MTGDFVIPEVAGLLDVHETGHEDQFSRVGARRKQKITDDLGERDRGDSVNSFSRASREKAESVDPEPTRKRGPLKGSENP